MTAHAIRPSAPPEQAAEVICATVARHYGVPVERLKSPDRTGPVSWARHVAMLLVWCSTNTSTARVGKIFGRTHSAVVHAMAAVRNAVDTNPTAAKDVKLFMEQFDGRPSKVLGAVVWMDATQELPDDEMTVLLALSDGECWTGFHLEGDWRFVCGELVDQGCGTRVTHWAEFPPPPTQP